MRGCAGSDDSTGPTQEIYARSYKIGDTSALNDLDHEGRIDHIQSPLQIVE